MSARQSSAVDQAIRLIRGGMTPYAAAKKVGIAMTTVYRACKRHGIKPEGRPKTRLAPV